MNHNCTPSQTNFHVIVKFLAEIHFEASDKCGGARIEVDNSNGTHLNYNNYAVEIVLTVKIDSLMTLSHEKKLRKRIIRFVMADYSNSFASQRFFLNFQQ